MYIQPSARAAISAADYTSVRTTPWKLISGNHHLPMLENYAGSE
jgi:hypothetical protein